LRNSGALKRIEEKWFGKDDAAKVLPAGKPSGGNGTLRFGTNGDVAPFVYVKDGELVGYDIEIVMAIAEKLGLKLVHCTS